MMKPSMWGGLVRVAPILVGIFYVVGMGMFLLFGNPNNNRIGSDPLAYMAAGMLGTCVLLSFVQQELRVRRLEQELMLHQVEHGLQKSDEHAQSPEKHDRRDDSIRE
jgi:hypothetical protein